MIFTHSMFTSSYTQWDHNSSLFWLTFVLCNILLTSLASVYLLSYECLIFNLCTSLCLSQKLVCIFPLLIFRTTAMWVKQVHCWGSDPASLTSQRTRSFDICKLQSVFLIYVCCIPWVTRSVQASCTNKASGTWWCPCQCRGLVACPAAAAGWGQLMDSLELCWRQNVYGHMIKLLGTMGQSPHSECQSWHLPPKWSDA